MAFPQVQRQHAQRHRHVLRKQSVQAFFIPTDPEKRFGRQHPDQLRAQPREQAGIVYAVFRIVFIAAPGAETAPERARRIVPLQAEPGEPGARFGGQHRVADPHHRAIRPRFQRGRKRGRRQGVEGPHHQHIQIQINPPQRQQRRQPDDVRPVRRMGGRKPINPRHRAHPVDRQQRPRQFPPGAGGLMGAVQEHDPGPQHLPRAPHRQIMGEAKRPPPEIRGHPKTKVNDFHWSSFFPGACAISMNSFEGLVGHKYRNRYSYF